MAQKTFADKDYVNAELAKKSNTGHTHNYAGSSSAGGAATSANKVNQSLAIKLNSGTTEGTNLFTFNGSTAKAINITPSSIGAAASSHGTHVSYGGNGSASTVSRSDHTHSYLPLSGGTMTGNVSYQFTGTGGHAMGLTWKNNDTNKTTFGGIGALANAGTGSSLYIGWGTEPWVASNNFQVSSSGIKYKNNKVYHAGDKPTPADIGAAAASHGNHVPTTQAAQNTTFLRNDNTWYKLTLADLGAAAASHGTHVTYGTTNPLVAGTASPGSADTVSRSDHVHPAQTTVSGNAGSANKVNNNLVVKLNGGSTEGTNLFTFNGSAAKTINITPSAIGAAASSHGTHLSLGETSSTAYRGDRGKTAYDHSQVAHAPSNAQKNSDITKAEIEAKLTGTITSHAHSSVNKTFITTPIYNPNNGVLVDFNLNVKSGVMAIVKIYGNSYSTNPPIEAIYQFYDYASGDIQNCTGTAISGPPITLKVYKADGKLKAWFQQPNSYCTFKVEVAYGNNSSTPNITLSNAAEPTTNITQTVTITPDRVYSAKYKPTAADIGAAASSHGTHVSYGGNGSATTVSRSDHTHNYAGSSSAGGAANSVKTNLIIKLNGGSTEGTNLFTFNGSTAKTVNITPSGIGAAASSHGNHVPATQTAQNNTFLRNDNTWQKVTPANIGAAAASHGTHVTFSTTTPKANGTAAVGSENTVARGDHIHPLQTSVSGSSGSCTGNAATATKFASAQSVALTGDVTGSASSQAGWSVATTLANSGVTAGSYGPSANASPAHGKTFSVPYLTVDAKGRVTAASTKTITLPADNNTDTKVTNTVNTSTKYYVTGSSSASTNTGTQIFDTNVYVDATAGKFVATTMAVNNKVQMQYNSTSESLDFVFI